MDFGIYPPEVNSGRMYAGPGSGPMLAAAQAWIALADELYSAANSYQAVVSELTGSSWSGPSSAAMTAAAASYVEWLSTTAAQAEETANQATAAVAAYEAAFALTVPPPVIAANRSLLSALVAMNFFGQNTAAIAATEAQYAEMWAQDATAMYTYAASSASAMVLTPFTPARPNTDSGGSAGQVDAVSQAASTSAGNTQNVVSSAAQTSSLSVADALENAVTEAPAASSSSTSSTLDTLSDLITIFVGVPANVASVGVGLPLDILGGPVDLPFAISSYLVGVHTDDIVSGWNGEQTWPGTDPAPVTGFPATLMNSGTVAGLGQADSVGGLSVPSAWTVAAPEIRPLALASPIASAGPTAAAPLELGSSTPLSQLGLAGMTGRAMEGPPSNGEVKDISKSTGARTVARAVVAAPEGDGEASQGTPRVVVTGVAAKIRELAKLRDEGDLTEEEYAQLKKRLLGR